MPPSSSLSSASDTISKRVQFWAENFPDEELFVFYQGKKRYPYTSQQILQLAGKFANRIRHQYGFKRYDIIANTLPNSPERVITDLGISLAGCISMNGQILLADGSDFFMSARNSRCNGVILQAKDESPAWKLLSPYLSGNLESPTASLSCDKAPDTTLAIFVSRRANSYRKPFLEDLGNSNDAVFIDTTICPRDFLHVFTTSGSTGYSKLVPRTHNEVIALAESLNGPAIVPSTTGDTTVMYSDRNLGWIGGYPFTTYCYGEKRVLLDWFDGHGRKRPEDIWRVICREKCTLASLRPLDIDSIIHYIESTGGSNFKLKVVVMSGQPIRKSQILTTFIVTEKVVTSYGSTEAGGLSATVFTRDSYIVDFLCGKPMSNLELKITDDNGQICKPRETGAILAKGGTVFKGYFNRLQDPDPNTVKTFTKDGWFITEDLGYFDEDGNIYVLGRNKDTIMYGSMVLYPGWLEAKILQNPDVHDACVVPVSDPVRFHEICACVTPAKEVSLTEEKIKAFCERIFVADLANEQTPMPKYFMILDKFPETATGKPDKQILKQMAEARFGIGRKVGKL